MQSIWLSLLWKEWREYKWKLATLSALVLSAMYLIAHKFGENYLDTFRFVTASLLIYAIIATLFIAMNVAGSENSRKTMPFLQSLPVSMWQAAVAKLILAGLTLIVPLVVGMFGVYFLFHPGSVDDEFIQLATDWDLRNLGQPWGISDWFTARTVGAVLSTFSMLLWLSAAGVNRSDEIRAGAVGFLTVAVVWLCFAFLTYSADKQDMPDFVACLRVAMAAAPGCLAAGDDLAQKNLPLYILTALVGHVAVGAWFLGRFGRVQFNPERGGARQPAAQPGYSLGLPMRSQFSAIAWKQMRETGPLALVALAGILAIAGFVSWITPRSRETFSEIFLAIGGSMSFFVVMVAGIGLYLDELQPGLNHFWRSRPSDFRLWFGVKFAGGILVLTTVVGIPLFLAGISQWSEMYNHEWKELWGGTSFIAWFFVITYSLAMTFQCLVRQPLYAAVLTLATLWLGAFVFFRVFGYSPPGSVTVTAMVLSLVGVVGLAWMTVKHDWGWKQ